MRALVTGGSGFIGRHAIPALQARGFEVHTLGRTALPGIPHHAADLLDPASVSAGVAAAGASHLLHLAWYVEPGIYWRSLRNLDWLGASLHLVQEFAAHGGTRLVGAGTCAEYEWGSPRLVEDETPCRPATLYGASKAALGQLLLAAADAAGLSVAWGRVFYLYGPGEGPGRLVSGAIETLARGGTFATSHGRQRRDFLHVADAAAAFAALLASGVRGAVNIGSGTAVPVRHILETLAAAIGRGQVEFGARPLPQSEPDTIEASTARLRLTGFAPRIGLVAGLQATIGAVTGYPSAPR